jgi:hypothetical protein
VTIFDRKAAFFALLGTLIAGALPSVVLAQTAGQITTHPMGVRLVQPVDANGVAVNLFDVPLSKNDCANPRAIQLQYTPPNINIGVMYIFASKSTDCALPSSGNYLNGTGEQVNTVGSPANFPKTLDVAVLSTRTVLGEEQCAEDSTVEVDLSSYAVCVVYKDTTNSNDTTNRVIDLLQVRVDTKPPVKIKTVGLTPGDAALNVTWTEEETTNVRTYRIVVVRTSDGAVSSDTSVTAPATSARIDGLENSTTYAVYVSAFDLAGNESEPSDAIEGTPVPTCDFWSCYQGREKGGFCFISTAAYGSYDAPFVQVFRDFRDRVLMQSSYGRAFILWYYKNGLPAALWLTKHEWARRAVGVALLVPYVAVWPFMRLTPLALVTLFGGFALAVALVVALWRRRGALTLFAMLLLFCAPAFALDDTYELLEVDENTGREHVAPAPRFELGVKVGPYYPLIDSDEDANRLYGLYFADGDYRQGLFSKNARVRVDLNFDVYVLQKFGLLGFTGTAGFWTAEGRARNCENGACATIEGLRQAPKTSDKVEMFIIPLSIGLVYKLDIFWRRWGVPLIPYVRGGIDAYFWRVDSGGRQARVAGSVYSVGLKPNGYAAGVTFGGHVNPGLAFALDVIEPNAARRAYSFLGIKGSYLTAEWMFAFIDDFGSASSWNLSHSTFNGGIAVEF